MTDLRILEEDEVSELVRKVEFLDYLVRTKGKSDKVSEVLPQFHDYFEEIKMYNTAVSMFDDYTKGEFTRICDNKDYENPDFREHIEWGKRLKRWRQNLATSKFADLSLRLSGAIPRENKKDIDTYLEVYNEIVAGNNSTYLKQEAGIDHSTPRSGMGIVNCLACQRAMKMIDKYFRRQQGSEQNE